jgi:prepilin-type processing-associated H-X9-DG protein
MEILEPPASAPQVEDRLPFHGPARAPLLPRELAPGGSGSRLDDGGMSTVAGPAAQRATAFTVVELLAVIAIIAVVATLGIGAVGSALERSRQSECANNLRQLASGVYAYAADNNGLIPPNNRTIGGKDTPWPVMLKPYVDGPTNGFKGTKSVYFCPCGRHPRGWNNTLPDYTCNARGGTGQNLTGGFSMDFPNQSIPPTRMTEIQRPSQMMMFADGFQGSDINQGSYNATPNFAKERYFGKPELPERGLAPRHSQKTNPLAGRFNVVFFDGHVESFEWNDPRLQDPVFLLDLVRRY